MIAICRTLAVCIVLLSLVAPGRTDAGAASPAKSGRPADIDWSRAQPYPIVLGEFHYEPAPIILRQGQPYLLRLQNAGRVSHTFTAPSFFRAVWFREDPAGEEAEASGGLVLAAGKTVEVGVLPLQAGSYAVECTKPLHGLFGMSGDIVVK